MLLLFARSRCVVPLRQMMMGLMRQEESFSVAFHVMTSNTGSDGLRTHV